MTSQHSSSFIHVKLLDLAKCQAIVGDGISIGRPCCGVFKCQQPLQNNRHRFCAMHSEKDNICAIVGCKNPVVEIVIHDADGGPPKTRKKKVCALPEHQKMEKKHEEHSTGSFLYQERLRQAHITQLTNSFSDTQTIPQDEIEEDFAAFEIQENGEAIILERQVGSVGVQDTVENLLDCPSKAKNGNRTFKAMFGRRRTHNEQTLVRPCGVVFARATMFGSEAVSNYLVMLKNAFSVPGAEPTTPTVLPSSKPSPMTGSRTLGCVLMPGSFGTNTLSSMNIASSTAILQITLS